ncbi:MAG: TIGR03960 family B12-binding radical SAM protein [Candidatus Anammoxibacter sp.]
MNETNNLRSIVANKILPYVEMPAQYTGGEFNSVTKNHDDVEVSVAIAFPDTYSIGMSHLGIHIIYFLLNKRNDTVCERVFAPWPDMEKEIRKNNIPLFSLETYTPINDFDIVGFSLQYEMSFTNVINMLNLARIPLKSEDRNDSHPIIIAGGPVSLSPEPMADFIDIFIIGDGEDVLPEFIDRFKEVNRDERLKRRDKIASLSRSIEGLYAPQLYDVEYDSSGAVKNTKPNVSQLPSTIKKASVGNLNDAYFPERLIVPYVKTTHDRIAIEIMRGCTQGCRFCNAGMTKRPKRSRTIEKIVNLAKTLYDNTGYDEISLTSLSTSDYPDLMGLMTELHGIFDSKKVNISFPSLRVSKELATLPALLNSVRKSSITIALEAASVRLRKIINKNITNEDLFNGVTEAYKHGWRLVKLYFMIGLPLESDEEIDEIIELANKVSLLKKDITGSAANVNVTIAIFVPKPHTPFQWQPMVTKERIKEIIDRIKKSNKRRSKIKFKFHNPERSILEGIFARGDRKLGKVILQAWSDGCRFDAWDEHFNYDKWANAFKKSSIDEAFYLNRIRTKDEIFPWDHINVGVKKSYLKSEEEKAFNAEITPDCANDVCTYCGAC